MGLQTIRSRNLSPLEPSVVTVGGTVRTYAPAVRDDVERRMGEILKGVTAAGGGTFELDYDRATLSPVAKLAPTTRLSQMNPADSSATRA